MKELVRRLASAVAPETFHEVTSQRARRRNERLEREWGCSALSARYVSEHGATVSGGPFIGLELPPSTYHRHIVPKLIGAYERDLEPVIEEVVSHPYRQVLDVGSAEGYYAVGLARRLPEATIHAFDTDPWARRVVQESVNLNAVSNVLIHGACTPEWLNEYLSAGAFILSDCEGYEAILLNPDSVPELLTADILVELHDERAPGIRERLRARFSKTHEIRTLGSEPRDPDYYPTIRHLPERDRNLAVADIRPDGQEWFFMKRRERN